MSKKKGEKWYNLSEEVREKLLGISKSFYTLKDYGMWIIGPGGYEPRALMILRTHNTLSYDIFIPTIIRLMQDGVLTAIFPIGMKTLDVVFYPFDSKDMFDTNAYARAGISLRKGGGKKE